MKLKYIGAAALACIVLFLVLQSIQEVGAKKVSGAKKSSGGTKSNVATSNNGKSSGASKATKTKSWKKKAVAAAAAFYTAKKVAKANKKVDILKSMHM